MFKLLCDLQEESHHISDHMRLKAPLQQLFQYLIIYYGRPAHQQSVILSHVNLLI